jgi:hypothetical protein
MAVLPLLHYRPLHLRRYLQQLAAVPGQRKQHRRVKTDNRVDLAEVQDILEQAVARPQRVRGIKAETPRQPLAVVVAVGQAQREQMAQTQLAVQAV